VEGVPVTILIDEQGKVAKYREGCDSPGVVQDAVEEIVNRRR